MRHCLVRSAAIAWAGGVGRSGSENYLTYRLSRLDAIYRKSRLDSSLLRERRRVAFNCDVCFSHHLALIGGPRDS